MNIVEAKKAIALSRLINTDSEYNKGYNDGLSLAVEKMEALEKSVRDEIAGYSDLEIGGYQSIAAKALRKVLGEEK